MRARPFKGVKTSDGWHWSPGEAARMKAVMSRLPEGEWEWPGPRRPKTQRSYDQLCYWFGEPMALLSEHTGYHKLQMHYLCLALCFGTLTDPATGMDVPVVPASKLLSTKQFSELIEWCPPWAFETHGVAVRLPNEVDLDSLPGGDYL